MKLTHVRDTNENMALKISLQQMNDTNEKEKRQLEDQMCHVIHSQAGQLAVQKDKISALQGALEKELSVSYNRIAEQEKEIKISQEIFLKEQVHEILTASFFLKITLIEM